MMGHNNDERNYNSTEVNYKEQNNLNNKDLQEESTPLYDNEELERLNETANSTQIDKPKLSLGEKFKHLRNNITVEPIVACYNVPRILMFITAQNLSLEKACRVNLNYTNEVCDSLTLRQTENYTVYEEQVQILVARIQGWKYIILITFPLILILFVGAWSDKTGRRKPCILIPVLGELLSCIGLMLNIYFYYELPAEVAAITETIFPSLTGGWFINFIGVFSYISDITTTENRTYRVGMVNMIVLLAFPLANALCGFLLRYLGYYVIFSISSSMHLFSLLYGYYGLEEPRKISGQEKELQTKSKGFLMDFFDVAHVAETFKVVFRKCQRNRRLRVLLFLCCLFFILGSIQGELEIVYLFTRFRFNWSEVQFSIWSTYVTVPLTLGTYFSILLFTNYLKLDDTLLCIISLGNKVAASFAYAFIRTEFELYMASFFEILNGPLLIALRSIATKLVGGEEIGKMNSLYALVEASSPLVYGPLYAQVYSATLQILPGLVFLMGSLLRLPAVGILVWLYFQTSKGLSQRDALATENQDPADVYDEEHAQ